MCVRKTADDKGKSSVFLFPSAKKGDTHTKKDRVNIDEATLKCMCSGRRIPDATCNQNHPTRKEIKKKKKRDNIVRGGREAMRA